MKKLFATISIFLLLPIVAAVAGCNTLSNDGWVEVQSITYTTEEGKKTTLYSICDWEPKNYILIEQSEYDNAPEEFKMQDSYGFGNFPKHIDRINFKTYADSFVGNTYFCTSYYGGAYYKITLTGYTLNYVKVKAISDKVIEIDYDNEIKQISTLSYEITYFTN